MTTVRVAVGECVRTGIDALRGLGYPFSVADRLSRMLTWSEATGLGGLAHIRDSEGRIRAAMGRPFSVLTVAAGQVAITILDAAGKSLLEAGPRTLDLANAEARLAGAGLAVARNTFGTLLLGELTQTAVERGLGTLILYRTAVDGSLPAQAGVLLRTPDSLAEIILAEGDAAGLIVGFAPVLARIVGNEAADGVVALLAEEVASASSTVAVTSFPIDRSDEIAALFREADRADRPVVERQLGAWQRALNEGFCVDAADWAYLHALVARIRIQTSERSRTHAG